MRRVVFQARPQRHARGARGVAGGVLCGPSNVEHLQVGPLVEHSAQVVNRNLPDAAHVEASLAPGLHAAAQVAAHRLVTDAREPHDRFVNLLAPFGDDDYRRAERDERARPRGELPAQSDVESAGDVTRAELRGRAHVEHDVPEVRVGRDLLGHERRGVLDFGERRRALAVDCRVGGKVRGGFRKVSRHHPDELVLRHRRERVVEAALLADGRRSLLRDVAPAHRACAVRGPDLDRVVELQKFSVQALVQHRRHHLRRVAARAREVGPSNVADEERVARQNLLRLRRDFRVNDDDGDAFGRVPRRFEKAQDDFPDLDLVAIVHRKVLEARARLRAEDDLRARARREFPVPAHEVCVQVRLDDVLDFQPSRLCLGDVLVNVALRVNDRGLAFRADEIGGVRETSEVKLFEVHEETPVRLAVRPGDFPRANFIPSGRLRAIIGAANDAARRASHTSVEYCLQIHSGAALFLLLTPRGVSFACTWGRYSVQIANR